MTTHFNPDARPADPFRIPEGYFDSFTARMMDRIPQPEVQKKPIRLSLWQSLRPYVSAAAVIAVVALGTKAMQNATPATGYDNNAKTVVATANDNASQDDLYSYLMLDDQSIYAYNYEQQ